MFLPSLTALRAFEAVARHKSLRKAAKELGVDHTVVSRHVRGLQESLDVPLLYTSRQGVVLTEAGAEYAAALSAALGQITQATVKLQETKQTRPLTIASLPGFALRWLTPRLPDFQRRNPNIDIAVRPSEERANLIGFHADAEILYGTPTEAELRYTHIATPRVFPVASPGWCAAHPDVTGPEHLGGASLLHEDSHEQWRRWFRKIGIPAPEPLKGPRLWHAHMALEAAKHGQGVALGNDLICGEDVAAGRLVEIGTTNVALEPYVFITRRDRWDEPALVRFRRWLLAEIRLETRPRP